VLLPELYDGIENYSIARCHRPAADHTAGHVFLFCFARALPRAGLALKDDPQREYNMSRNKALTFSRA
jgi:hypothetical protein